MLNCWRIWTIALLGLITTTAFATVPDKSGEVKKAQFLKSKKQCVAPKPTIASCTKIIKKQKEEKKLEKAKSNPWKGTNAQLGYIVNTGNTSNADLSAGLNILYTKTKWANSFQANAYLSRNMGVVTKEQYFVTNQFNYYFNSARKNYVYSNLRFVDNRFSPYEYQVVFSVGYGRDLVKTKNFTLSAQVGPGMRHNFIRTTRLYENHLILTTGMMMNWQISSKVSFSEQLNYDFGQPFNYLKSVTALTASLAGHLAAQLSYTVQYYSTIPMDSVNTKKTDTITNIALVYNF